MDWRKNHQCFISADGWLANVWLGIERKCFFCFLRTFEKAFKVIGRRSCKVQWNRKKPGLKKWREIWALSKRQKVSILEVRGGTSCIFTKCGDRFRLIIWEVNPHWWLYITKDWPLIGGTFSFSLAAIQYVTDEKLHQTGGGWPRNFWELGNAKVDYFSIFFHNISQRNSGWLR